MLAIPILHDAWTGLMQPDSLSDRIDSYYRCPKDYRLFHSATETQRNRRFRCRSSPHPLPLALNRILDRTLRPVHPLRWFPCYNWAICGQYPRGWTLYPAWARNSCWWQEQCRAPCMIYAVAILPAAIILERIWRPWDGPSSGMSPTCGTCGMRWHKITTAFRLM